MRRGDVILAREPGTPASKARPCLIMQRTGTLNVSTKITACPLTTMLRGLGGQRPLVVPSPLNGLTRPSEVQFDWVHSFRRECVLKMIGQVEDEVVDQVDAVLRAWLDL